MMLQLQLLKYSCLRSSIQESNRYDIEIDANRAEQARALGIETLQAKAMDVRCPASSPDRNRNLCQVRGGADGQLSRNRRHYLASVEMKQANVSCPRNSRNW